MNLPEFIRLLDAHGSAPRKTPNGFEAKCPAHPDKSPSLGISEGTDGRILLCCRAGCSAKDVVAALGLRLADLFADKPERAPKPSIAAFYDYDDEYGALLFQTVRLVPKDFRQRRPDPNKPGGWIWNLGDTRRVLYRLPELIAAIASSRGVFVVEGEKDCDTLAKAGFVATCNPMGAGKWLPEHTATLKGLARVVVIADKDAPGRKHAAEVACALRSVVGSVRLIELPDRDGKPVKDAADWFGAGGTADELRALVKAAPEFAPAMLPESVTTAREATAGNPAADKVGKPDDEAALQRLAALSPVDFDRCAKCEADALGISVGTLRSEVAKRRRNSATDGLQRCPWQVTPEPWPDPVDGCQLLNELRASFARYLVLPDSAAPTLALWIVHTYCFQLGRIAAYAALLSPEKRCGKSTALGIASALAHRALAASNVSPAALFRVIEKDSPTLLIDETDSFVGDNEELRGILNAGFTRETAFVVRCVGDDSDPKAFRVFGPKLFAGIGKLPGTLADRSIIIPMRRKRPGETVQRFVGFDGHELRCKCVRWAHDHEAQLTGSDPTVPNALNDRAADLWRPLLAIADLAGGDWPEIARAAALELSADAKDESQAVKLLESCRAYFRQQGRDRVLTRDLLAFLNAQEEEPWNTFNGGDGINPRQLADRLKNFHIGSRDMRIGNDRAKGYDAEDFAEAFERYLAAEEESIRDNATTPENTGESSTFPCATAFPALTAGETDESPSAIGLSRCHASRSPSQEQKREEAMLL